MSIVKIMVGCKNSLNAGDSTAALTETVSNIEPTNDGALRVTRTDGSTYDVPIPAPKLKTVRLVNATGETEVATLTTQ